jgi:hypothetical protein
LRGEEVHPISGTFTSGEGQEVSKLAATRRREGALGLRETRKGEEKGTFSGGRVLIDLRLDVTFVRLIGNAEQKEVRR